MKKSIFIIILFILLMCSIIGVLIFISPRDATTTLAKDNVITENTIDSSTNIISDEVVPENNNVIVEEPKLEIAAEPEKEIPKQEDIQVEKTVSKTSSTSTKNTTTPTASTKTNTQSNNAQSTNNTTTKSTTSPSNVENTKPTETTTTQPVEKPTEQKPVTQPTRCTHNNNHGMDVGNSGKWFNSKSEAIAFYEQKVNYWSNLWETYQIEDDEYYKNCPTGYEYWSCMYCNKWTINLYYR